VSKVRFTDNPPRIVGSATRWMNGENLIARCASVRDIKRGFPKPLMNRYDGSRGTQKAYDSLRFRNHEHIVSKVCKSG
jgi:hypothetical protein